MGHIGTAIGGIVGVIIALLVGLNLTGNVFDETAAINGSREPYSTGTGVTLLGLGDSAAASTAGTVSATLSDGVVETVTVSGGAGYTANGRYSVVKAPGATNTGGGAIVTCDAANCATTTLVDGGGDGILNAVLDKFIAIRPIIGILPTVIVVGLFIAGSAVGGAMGRITQTKYFA